jgi:hypothetical protein
MAALVLVLVSFGRRIWRSSKDPELRVIGLTTAVLLGVGADRTSG